MVKSVFLKRDWMAFLGKRVPYLKAVSLEYDGASGQYRENPIPQLSRSAGLAETPGKWTYMYIGLLKGGKPHGYGELRIVPPGQSHFTEYRGMWKDGRYHGIGYYHYMGSCVSDTYFGFFKNGERVRELLEQ
jgi:hypothetical protein